MDEDEVEEGEILTCLECDAELEVVQIHPVRLNVISEDDEDDDAAENLDEDGDESDEDDGNSRRGRRERTGRVARLPLHLLVPFRSSNIEGVSAAPDLPDELYEGGPS